LELAYIVDALKFVYCRWSFKTDYCFDRFVDWWM